MPEQEEFVFYMPVIEKEDSKEQESFTTAGAGKVLPVSMDQINEMVKGLSGYSLDTIELHVKGVARTGPVVEFFIGAEGEAGLKLVLNKRK
ncbi:hypothetical protein AC739_04885 [Planococcus glaciei]|uniref:hypothetical protein n=1 Tax=Planococcus glaciei TaxID=459472 RepID=UPI00069CE9CC|nr:hypothetical protein [Planococcus glaciei]KOF11186.1 hypothetical protein AC739_04885 [Planococcus glaciei]MBX0313821.1 hypothetical protein [Planococcus glaciei]SDH19898.1 hypothetical protein SAMN04487975_103197 [Planococcus glaciei]